MSKREQAISNREMMAQDDVNSTKETFLPGGWVRTGDEGYVKNHEIYVVDRLKELIKVRGFQVAPAEVSQEESHAVRWLAGRAYGCIMPQQGCVMPSAHQGLGRDTEYHGPVARYRISRQIRATNFVSATRL